jgi:hypothetical protein
MDCSLDEAFDLFLIPWCTSGVELWLFVNGGVASDPCKVVAILPGSERHISIELTRSGNQRTVDMSRARLSYEDSRAGLFPELIAKKWVCFLLAEFPDNEGSLLFAVPI